LVERPEELTPVQAPVHVHRGPSRGRVLARRVFGLAFLALLLGVLGWGAVYAVGEVRERAAPPPAPPPPPPPPKPFRIIFPEGFTRAEMAQRIVAVRQIAREKRGARTSLSAKTYLRSTARSRLPGQFAGDRKPRSLEGFLFPATYEFTRKTTSKQLVERQLEAFQRNWGRVDLRFARAKNLTPYDVLIIASMVEKEAIAPDERALVAAVIYNRLKAKMALGIDATIRYGLGVPGTEALRESHLENPSPYNTRIHAGLPPTPIANPGLASMQAAAHPAPVKYLFFVRKPDKVHHFFTASESEFYAKSCEYGYSC
jgi:peptidoglycan lytic transglycosylase G